MAKFNVWQFTFFLIMLSTFAQTKGLLDSRQLDEATPDLEKKCGNCPCNSPCNPIQPPPSPPPPPPKNPTPTTNCPPPPHRGGGGGQNPPNPPYIYINGPPDNLYPIDYSGSGRSFSIGIVPFLICTFLRLLAF